MPKWLDKDSSNLGRADRTRTKADRRGSQFLLSGSASIDPVLTLLGGKLWAIEVERSSSPKVERGFHRACAELAPATRFVVYPRNERYPLNTDIEAIGLPALAQVLGNPALA